MQDTLNAPPQPECTARCHCTFEPPLNGVATLIAAVQQPLTLKACKHKLDHALRLAHTLNLRVHSRIKRHCIAPPDHAAILGQEALDLAHRMRALSQSGFCKGRKK